METIKFITLKLPLIFSGIFLIIIFSMMVYYSLNKKNIENEQK